MALKSAQQSMVLVRHSWCLIPHLSSLTSLKPGKFLHGSRVKESRMELLALEAVPFLTRPPSMPLLSPIFGLARPTWSHCAMLSVKKLYSTSFKGFTLKAVPSGGRKVQGLALSKRIANTATKNSLEVDSFLADPSITWRSLGLSKQIADALERAELQHPSLVQAVSIPLILSTGDVIVAAETGSGKTHAYLAPIFHKLHDLQQAADDDEKLSPTELGRRRHKFALVLCPNATLCQQAADMANALQNSAGDPLLQVAVICGGKGWPIYPPDLVVATPAALVNNLFAFDPRRRRRSAFVRDLVFVVVLQPNYRHMVQGSAVFDEADMLLGGGFVREVGRLIDILRLEEKQLSRAWELEKVQGTRKVQGEYQPWTDFLPAEGEESDENSEVEGGASGWSEALDDEPSCSGDINEMVHGPGKQGELDRRVAWLRAKKQYKRSKQYVFVAATLPQSGKRTPGAVLKQKFPEASWVNGRLLHRHNPRLEQHWVEVTEDTRIPSLLAAVSEHGIVSDDSGTQSLRTMVFANSVETVDAVGRVLERAGVKCMRYHRDLSSEERGEALQVFEQHGGVLVCTDSAARGLDIPNIGHVVQAEFASSAVEFLHRIGRTARAGKPGKVTSLFTAANRPLVDAVRQAATVEGAFSRKRSFRNKIKKYGTNQGVAKTSGAILE